MSTDTYGSQLACQSRSVASHSSVTVADALLSPSLSSCLPYEEQRILRGLEPSRTSTWTLARAEVYQEHACTLRHLHNAALPIHSQIPLEILMHIFAFLRPDSLKEARLMSVCRRWRDVLLGTTEFWADLLPTCREHIYEKTDVLEMLLARSGILPLRLLCCSPTILCSSKVIAPHLYRISDLRIDTDNGGFVQLYSLLKGGGLPNLVSVVVNMPSRMPAPPGLYWERCEDAALPRLRHLELPTKLLHPNITVASLESLHIRCSGGLKSFMLRSRMPLEDCPTSSQALQLPALEELHLMDTTSTAAKKFLDRIIIPQHTSICCRSTVRSEEDLFFSGFLSPDHDLFCINAIDHLTLSDSGQNNRWVEIRTSLRGQQLLSVQLSESTTRAATMARLAREVPPVFRDVRSLRALTLEFTRLFPTRAELSTLLRALRGITHLTLGSMNCSDDEGAHAHALEALASPAVCPSLAEMTLVVHDLVPANVGGLACALATTFGSRLALPKLVVRTTRQRLQVADLVNPRDTLVKELRAFVRDVTVIDDLESAVLA
ncbi:hypothetical protein BD413DRAFT_204670 [Trametes elegans]|nr:hypothetical protein BD413DRAFT_204670 [Trametes elegans]